MQELDEQFEFLKLIASRLDDAGISYMATGSVAMAFYSVARMTRDIDLVVECGLGDVDRLVALFSPDCYVDAVEMREAIQSRSMFNVIHNEWVLRADFIVRKNEEYRRVEFERRRRVSIHGASVAVVSPEDLILSKLAWSKDTESELQRRDVRAIIRAVKDLEWPYLEKWAVSLSVSDLLDGLRKP